MRKKNFSYKLILKRPMVLAAAVLAAGIITGQYIGINGCIALIVLSIIISIVTGILTRARFVYMVPILFALGICLILYANMPDKIYNGTSAINGAVHESYISVSYTHLGVYQYCAFGVEFKGFGLSLNIFWNYGGKCRDG